MTDVAIAIGGRSDRGGLELSGGNGSAGKWDALVGADDGSLPRRVIGISPGGDRPNRRWPAAKFALAAGALAARCGARVLIFGGPGEEPIGQEIQTALNGAALNLGGQLNLRDLPFFINRCDLLITNDSGPMHMAAALKTPVVALFGPGYGSLFQALHISGPLSRDSKTGGVQALQPGDLQHRALPRVDFSRRSGGKVPGTVEGGRFAQRPTMC